MTIILLIIAIAALAARLISAEISGRTLGNVLADRGISPTDEELKRAADKAVRDYFRLKGGENSD